MEQKNEMMITFDSRSSNESFARVAVAAFTTQLNPTLEEVADIKTAVSEAITNAIIHGYDNQVKKIRIRCRVSDRTLYVEVEDDGKGIADVKKAMEYYPEEKTCCPLFRCDQVREIFGWTGRIYGHMKDYGEIL